ncbi:MAG: 4-(cytidine 5'-diphospho)-2-C-methyl-D-erythritol kinase [Cyclobacteriaceae bacterium]|nr:4-(cytidine 5'-diphospho)-2-C-methyl-D-erythritol kinase [Cyclobacteriaceae bacterium]UYN86333.1 MAG: 4-(cytidine 5'-diphospho)-2-C-methyl-D-erythritol kinase [Cyclobacteriaceae bacterium]
MVSFPPCKINLGLHILSKRPDGYHAIETCFYPVPWTDILEVVPADKFSFVSTGIPIPDSPDDNLCVKAFNLLQHDFHLGPLAMHLHKIIPMGAGLGGGSSDAATALVLINEVFQLKLSTGKLMEYAAQLGSDCAFFIENKPMIGTGRGEILQQVEINLQGKYLVVIKPGIHVSTAHAYAMVKPAKPERELKAVLKMEIEHWRAYLKNDFEESVFQKFPAIASIKQTLYDAGAQYACMSGSGSSVYGIFAHPVDLRADYPHAVYWSGQL